MQSKTAHETDPRDVQAALMYADALVVTGNQDKVCELLRPFKRVPRAQEQARAAGCPTD
jgi:hypothetical protein